MINAPRVQGGVIGQRSAIQCSTTLPRTRVEIRKYQDDSLSRPSSSVTFREIKESDKGAYVCEIKDRENTQIFRGDIQFLPLSKVVDSHKKVLHGYQK